MNKIMYTKIKEASEGRIITRFGSTLTQISMKYMPDASIFAVVLTFIAFLLGLILTNSSAIQMVTYWYKGLWELLAFAMQMCLIIITGSAVADAPMIKKWIRKVALIPNNGKQAACIVTFVSILVSFLHWGLSLILGALLAKEMAKQLNQKGVLFEYGLIAAGAYVGQMTWQGMLSSSIGLLIATPNHFLQDKIGVIPLGEYIFNPMNIVFTVLILVFPPLFAMYLHPNEKMVTPLEVDAIKAIQIETEYKDDNFKAITVGEKLNHSRIVSLLLAVLGFSYIFYHFTMYGFSLDINMVNTIFLFFGILLHKNIAAYLSAVKAATGGVAGIIFQFPLYAGIMGMIKYSGLVSILAGAIVSISTESTFYIWTFLSAALVNFFVPSGGGQWAVQGPIAVDSALSMNADIIKTALCVGYGNTWTNMAQPFWAIALLGVTGLKAKDIMGYSMAIMILSGIIFLGCIYFIPV